jgi:hypothetical protein
MAPRATVSLLEPSGADSPYGLRKRIYRIYEEAGILLTAVSAEQYACVDIVALRFSAPRPNGRAAGDVSRGRP